MKKKGLLICLQIALVLLGGAVLAFLLWEPQVEGRNANATFFEIYFKDPFLAYAYIASIPFFVAIYQAFKVVGYAIRDSLVSPESVSALRTIKLCFITLIGFVAIGMLIIILNSTDDRADDPAGAVAIGILITFSSVIIVSAAAMTERIVQKTLVNRTVQPQ